MALATGVQYIIWHTRLRRQGLYDKDIHRGMPQRLLGKAHGGTLGSVDFICWLGGLLYNNVTNMDSQRTYVAMRERQDHDTIYQGNVFQHLCNLFCLPTLTEKRLAIATGISSHIKFAPSSLSWGAGSCSLQMALRSDVIIK